MKQILILLIIFFLGKDLLSQNGWLPQFSGTIANLNSIRFLNEGTGFCVGDNGIVLKTTNGGTAWNKITIGASKNLRSIFFSSPNVGFIVGDTGAAYKSSDGGNSWINIGFHHGTLVSIFFLNDTIGYVGGDTLFRTLNSGNSWNRIGAGEITRTYSIFFVNYFTGWNVGNYVNTLNDVVAKTTNGGGSWDRQTVVVGAARDFRTIFFIDSLNGWLGSPNFNLFNQIYKTTNGGTNWYSPFPHPPFTMYSNCVYFVSRDNGWSVGASRTIWHTTDSGNNWSLQTPYSPGADYNSIFLIDSLTGWCVGDSGKILKTTTGGLTYLNNSNFDIPKDYSLSQNFPNPFNPGTTINFEISNYSFVSIKVYDALGEEISNLVNERKSPGSHEVVFDGDSYPSGLYFYSLEIDGIIRDTKRMILLK